MSTILEEVAARVEGAETGHGGRTLWLSGVRADIVDRKLCFERCDCDEYDPFYPEHIRAANRLLDAYEAVRAERIAKRVAELVGGRVSDHFAWKVFVDFSEEYATVCVDCSHNKVSWVFPPEAEKIAAFESPVRAAFEQAKREVDGGC